LATLAHRITEDRRQLNLQLSSQRVGGVHSLQSGRCHARTTTGAGPGANTASWRGREGSWPGEDHGLPSPAHAPAHQARLQISHRVAPTGECCREERRQCRGPGLRLAHEAQGGAGRSRHSYRSRDTKREDEEGRQEVASDQLMYVCLAPSFVVLPALLARSPTHVVLDFDLHEPQ
jgi:hypothetical protein